MNKIFSETYQVDLRSHFVPVTANPVLQAHLPVFVSHSLLVSILHALKSVLQSTDVMIAIKPDT
jgi:hypothetical protein